MAADPVTVTCREPGCDEPSAPGAWLCEEHRDAANQRLRLVRRRSNARRARVVTEEERTHRLAVLLVHRLRLKGESVAAADAHRLVALPAGNDRLRRALKLATASEWLTEQGDTFAVGSVEPSPWKVPAALPTATEPRPATPKPEHEAAIARVVGIIRAADRPVGGPELYEALNTTEGALTPVLAQARREGRIESIRSGGLRGYGLPGWSDRFKVDPQADALAVARLVHKNGTATTRAALTDALGIPDARLVTAVKIASGRGWVETQMSRGYMPGAVAPPADEGSA